MTWKVGIGGGEVGAGGCRGGRGCQTYGLCHWSVTHADWSTPKATRPMSLNLMKCRGREGSSGSLQWREVVLPDRFWRAGEWTITTLVGLLTGLQFPTNI